MDVLVTGGAGFVGRWFVKHLIVAGHRVVCVDNLHSGGGGLHPSEWPLFDPLKFESFEYLEVDCREFFADYHNSKGDGLGHSFDLVIHLAAVVGGRLTIERNPMAVAQDLEIDAAFWRYAVESRPGHVICFSSSAAYPVDLQSDHHHVFLRENDLDFSSELGMPDLSYGWAKLTNEYLGILAHQSYGLKVASYRPFSGYGEDQSLSYPFPSICERAVFHDPNEDFMVWGSGLQGRDFIHISDVVEAVMSTYSDMVDGSSINLSTGVLTTFKELAEMFLRELGSGSKVVGDPTMPSGVFARVGSPELLHKKGFIPKVSLEEGVSRAIKFRKSLGKQETGFNV